MAENVIIDIDARTKLFEDALDDLTGKVRSSVGQIDKAFSTSGNAEKSIKSTSRAVSELHTGLKQVSIVAAGNIIANEFEKAFAKIKKVGNEIYSTTKRMQSLEMGMKSLVTSDLVKTGQVADYTEATQKAEAETKKLLDWFKELSLKSPYELVEVMESFKQNANMGQSVATAKKTTEAILALGAGLGMGQAEMKRFSAALAQTGATGRITAMDLRQFANNGFGMDKMNQIFSILSEKYKVAIKDNNDFNKAIADGKITTDNFFEALNTFALDNYGNAVDAMASTIEGLMSSLGDIKVSAINDLFLEASKTVSKTIAPYVEYLMQLLNGGDFTRWGKGINKWVEGILTPFQKLGSTLENGVLTRALNSLRDFFTGKSLNLGAVKVFLSEIGGEEFADSWIERLQKIKGYIDSFLEHKDLIIGAIKGIGAAIAVAFAVNTISKFSNMLISTLTNPLTLLIGAGAAIGLAWNSNLFNIQDHVHNLINYVTELYNIFKQDGWSGVWNKLKETAENAFDEIREKIKTILPEDIQRILEDVWSWIERIGQAIGGITIGVGILALIGKLKSVAASISTIIELIGVLTSVISWPVVAAVALAGTLVALAGVGLSILGQFIDFGELLKNIFQTVKDSVTNVVNGIITNVAPKFQQLLETLQPFITALKVIIGIAGTAIAGILLSAGVLIVGALNGIIKGLDDIIAAIVDAVDFIFSIIRLPFDLVEALFEIIIGVVTGDNKRIEDAVSGLVDRLKHIWTTFKAFWVDVWGFIKDFFSGIWDVITKTIDSVDISAGLERLFGKEVAQKFEEIRDKVLGYIDEIRNAWQHMLGLLNGDIVVMNNGQEINKKTDEAFQSYNSKRFGDDDVYYNAIKDGTRFEEFESRFFTKDKWNETLNTMEQVIDHDAAKAKWESYSDTNLFEEFTQSILNDIQSAIEKYDPNMKKSAESRKDYADKYITSKYDWATEDPYMQSLLDGLYERLGLNITAIEKNTTSTEANTEAEKKPTTNALKAESEAPLADVVSHGIVQLTNDQLDLMQRAVKSINDEVIQSLGTDKHFNAETIKQLQEILVSSEGKSLDRINDAVNVWLTETGTSKETQQLIRDALSSATDENEILTMLGVIVEALNTGNLQLISEIKTNTEATDYEKTAANIGTELFDNFNNRQKASDSIEIPILGKVTNFFDDFLHGDSWKELNANTDEQISKLEAQNNLISEAIDQLGLLETISKLEDDNVTDKEFKEAKTSFYDSVNELGATKEQLEEIKKLIASAATPEELASIMRSFTNALTVPKQISTNTDVYYEMEMALRDFITNQLPTSLGSLKKQIDDGLFTDTNRLNFEMVEMQRYLKYSSSYSLGQLQDAFTNSIGRSGLPKDIQEAYINAINAEGVDKDFVSSYITQLITSVEQAGLLIANSVSDTPEQTEKTYYDVLTYEGQKALNAQYNNFLDGHYHEINRAINEGLKDIPDPSADDIKKIREAVLKNRGYDFNSYLNSIGTGSNMQITAFLNNMLPKLNKAQGDLLDRFYTVTPENYADAKEYVTDSHAWTELHNSALTESSSVDFILERLSSTIDGIFGKDYADDTAARMSSIITALPVDLRSSALVAAMLGLNSQIETLNGDNTNGLSAIESKVASIDNKTGGTTSGANAAKVDYFKELYENYNNATTQEEKILYQDLIQGVIDVTRDREGGIHAGTSIDDLNKDINLWNDLVRDISLYGFTDTEDWNLASRQAYYMNLHKKDPNYDKELEELRNTDPEQYKLLTENKDKGMLGYLFGSDFDFSELGKQLFSGLDFSELGSQLFGGLSDSLNEDTINNLKELLGLEVSADLGKNWHKLATALSTLGMAFQSIGDATTNGDAVLNLLRQVRSMARVEIKEDVINGWMTFGQALTKIGGGLQAIMKALGTSVTVIGDVSNLNPAMAATDGMKGVLGPLQNLFDMEIKEDVINRWGAFADAVKPLGDALGAIKSAFSADGLDTNALKSISNNDEKSVGGLVALLQKFVDINIDNEKWTAFASSMDLFAVSMSTITSALTEDTLSRLSSLANIAFDQTKVEGWKGFADALTSMGTALQSIGILFGIGMTEDTQEGMGAGMEAEQGMMSTDIITALTTFMSTQIDPKVIEGWALFADEIERVSNAIIGMMVVLTNGEDGELGNGEAGEILTTSFRNLAAVAEEVTPILQSTINPELDLMRTNLELILDALTNITKIMRGAWVQAVGTFSAISGLAIVTLQALAREAQSAASKYEALAGQIWNAVAALKALAELTGGKKKKDSQPTYAAGGMSGFRYGTAIVGEHGPELITTGSRALNVFTNNTLMDEIAHTRHVLNTLSNSAEYVAYNRILGAGGGGTTNNDNSQNFNTTFGNVIGDDAFRSMLEDEFKNVVRRELRLAR